MKPTKKEKEWVKLFKQLRKGDEVFFCTNCGEKNKFNATWVTRNKMSAPMNSIGEIDYDREESIYKDENDDDDQFYCGKCQEEANYISDERINEIVIHIDDGGNYLKNPVHMIYRNRYLLKWLAANSI